MTRHHLDTPEFRNFIASELRIYGGVKTEQINNLLSNPKNMEIFRSAFTHRSHYPLTDYEKLEFIGDAVIETVVVNYISKRFPEIKTEKWMTGVKHKLVGRKVLATLSINAGYNKFVTFKGKSQKDYEEMSDPKTNDRYIKTMTDIFEGFMGAVSTIIDDNQTVGRGRLGPGIRVCENIISSYLDKIDISLKYEDVFDNFTRIKEIYDKRQWNINASTTYTENSTGGTNTTIWAYVLGDQSRIQANRKILVKNVWGQSKDISKQKAAGEGLKALELIYGIMDYRTHPSDIPDKTDKGL